MIEALILHFILWVYARVLGERSSTGMAHDDEAEDGL